MCWAPHFSLRELACQGGHWDLTLPSPSKSTMLMNSADEMNIFCRLSMSQMASDINFTPSSQSSVYINERWYSVLGPDDKARTNSLPKSNIQHMLHLLASNTFSNSVPEVELKLCCNCVLLELMHIGTHWTTLAITLATGLTLAIQQEGGYNLHISLWCFHNSIELTEVIWNMDDWSCIKATWYARRT